MNRGSIINRTKKLAGICIVVVLAMVMSFYASAYQTRSGNFYSVTLTGNQAADMVAVARKQSGRSKESMEYTEPWCADFVLDCARKAGVPKSVIPYTTAGCAACGTFYNKMLSMGGRKISASEVKAGDLVFYYCSACKGYKHVGICAGGGTYIEGNMGGRVLTYSTNYIDTKKHSTKGGTVKRLYIRPAYITNDVSYSAVTLSQSSYTYNMLSHKPAATVKLAGKVLRYGTDYTTSYSNCTNAGTATVVITGRGSYKGSRKVNYTIKPLNISGATGFSVSDYVYSGKQIRPSIRFSGSKTLANMIKKSGNINISYGKNVNTGKGTVKITGTRNLTGSKTLTFYIVPKKVSGLKTKVSGPKVTLSWSRATGASGYEIAYKKASASKWTTAGRTSSSTQVYKLSRLTKYQFRVRAYVTVNGTKVYGNWSDTITKTTGLF